MAKAAGISKPVAKTELAGYEIFSAKDQMTPAVLGSGTGMAASATTRTVENTAKVLLKIGRISNQPKNPVAAVDSQFAAAATK